MRALTRLTALLALAAGVLADQQDMRGWSDELPVVVLPGEIPGPLFASGIRKQGFGSEWEWLALVCETKCVLEPAKLLTTDTQIHPHFDEPLPGHVYSLDRKFDVQPLVLLRGLSGDVRKRPKTWLHAALGSYPPSATPGTREIDIPMPGETARIVPRFTRRSDNVPMLNVYLETKTQRQLLGSMAEISLDGPRSLARGPQLLRWAGDLDGDEKLDLIMSISSISGIEATVTLFLSSAAKPGELVGMAGNFYYLPVDYTGC